MGYDCLLLFDFLAYTMTANGPVYVIIRMLSHY